MQVAVSYIKSKYDLRKTISLISKTDADYIHVDVMDGIFTVNKTYNIEDIFTYLINKKLDVHLMVKDIDRYIDLYSKLKPEYITFHIEDNKDIDKLIDKVHSLGIKCGLALNPETKVEDIYPYLDKIEEVLVMTVTPGAGGQKFIGKCLSKIDKLMELKGRYIVNVDGGINEETVKFVKSDMVVSGSYVCLSENYQKSIDNLR